MENGKTIDNEKEENIKLNRYINDCINIEKNVENIKDLKQNIEKCNTKIIKINFIPNKKDEINKFISTITTFGRINEEIKIKNKNNKKQDKDNKENKKENKKENWKNLDFEVNWEDEEKEWEDEEKEWEDEEKEWENEDKEWEDEKWIKNKKDY